MNHDSNLYESLGRALQHDYQQWLSASQREGMEACRQIAERCFQLARALEPDSILPDNQREADLYNFFSTGFTPVNFAPAIETEKDSPEIKGLHHPAPAMQTVQSVPATPFNTSTQGRQNAKEISYDAPAEARSIYGLNPPPPETQTDLLVSALQNQDPDAVHEATVFPKTTDEAAPDNRAFYPAPADTPDITGDQPKSPDFSNMPDNRGKKPPSVNTHAWPIPDFSGIKGLNDFAALLEEQALTPAGEPLEPQQNRSLGKASLSPTGFEPVGRFQHKESIAINAPATPDQEYGIPLSGAGYPWASAVPDMDEILEEFTQRINRAFRRFYG